MTAKQTPLVDLLRVHADDIHSAHGHNRSSTLLSQAADRIVALEAECDQLRAENAEAKRDALRERSDAQQKHIERLCNHSRIKCVSSGCTGCAVCDPVAALAARSE